MPLDILSIGNVITMITCLVAVTVFVIRLEGKGKALEEKIKSDTVKVDEKLKSEIKILEDKIKSEYEINKLKFENKAEKIDALFNFKEAISKSVTDGFANVTKQIADVNETLKGITTTLNLSDVTPKRRDGDKV